MIKAPKNISIENKVDKFFKSLKIHNYKNVNIFHKQDLPSNIEGMQEGNNIFLSKNFRVSNKKTEAILMHEVLHFAHRTKKIKDDEKLANKIENAYLNHSKKYEINEQEVYDRLYLKVRKLFFGVN